MGRRKGTGAVDTLDSMLGHYWLMKHHPYEGQGCHLVYLDDGTTRPYDSSDLIALYERARGRGFRDWPRMLDNALTDAAVVDAVWRCESPRIKESPRLKDDMRRDEALAFAAAMVEHTPCGEPGTPERDLWVERLGALSRFEDTFPALVSAEWLPDDLMSRMARSGDPDFVARLAARDDLPDRVQRYIFDDVWHLGDIYLNLAEHGSDPVVLRHLYRAGFPSDVIVAGNPKAPAELLSEISKSQRADLRGALISNPSLPRTDARRLARSKSLATLREFEDALVRVAQRVGIHEDNTAAIDLMRKTDWWELRTDEPAVRLILNVHPN